MSPAYVSPSDAGSLPERLLPDEGQGIWKMAPPEQKIEGELVLIRNKKGALNQGATEFIS